MTSSKEKMEKSIGEWTQHNGIADVIYICKGEGVPCYMYPYCIYREDPVAETDQICSHTPLPEFAKYGPCEDPENHPERFIFQERPMHVAPSFYWEIEHDGNV